MENLIQMKLHKRNKDKLDLHKAVISIVVKCFDDWLKTVPVKFESNTKAVSRMLKERIPTENNITQNLIC